MSGGSVGADSEDGRAPALTPALTRTGREKSIEPGSPHDHGQVRAAHSPLATHGRFAYSGIAQRPPSAWPGGERLAVYIGFNIEHFTFGEAMGANIAPPSPQPDVLNHSWREYGNRVGVWRCLDLFNEVDMPAGVLVNTALYDHCPEVIDAFVKRGDELVAHGHTNSQRQGTMPEAEERALIAHCRDRMARAHGTVPKGWLSPWISESSVTPDLLQEAGFDYTLNWCHDDQPNRMKTRNGAIWSVPYPQELNDIPMIIGRQMDAKDFAQMIIDQFDEMLEQAHKSAEPHGLVMGIALHPYIVGQPYRLRHLRRALRHIVAHAKITSPGEVWLTTPGAIADAAHAANAADADAATTAPASATSASGTANPADAQPD